MKNKLVLFAMSIIAVIALVVTSFSSAFMQVSAAATLSVSAASGYTIDRADGNVTGLVENTSYANFVAAFTGGTISVVNTKGTKVTSGYIGTGFKVRLMSGTSVVDSLTVILKGDTDGNGTLDTTDFIKIKRYFQKLNELSGVYYVAGDINEDNSIDSTDFISIKRHFARQLNIFEKKDVKMPSLVSKALSTAQAELAALGLACTYTVGYSSTVAAGYVISQSISAGTSVEVGTSVKLVVSIGAQEVHAPYLIGKTRAEAENLVKSSGLEANILTDYSSTVTAGYVISQSPASGSAVAAGSTVTFTVSLGVNIVKVKVPDLYGKTENQAKTTLVSAGLKYTIVNGYSSTVMAGYVMSQSIAANSMVDANTVITVTVSLGSQYVVMPGVTGQSEAAAKSAVESCGLVPVIKYEYNNSIAVGIVISQSIAAYSNIKRGSSVDIIVSLGKDANYTPINYAPMKAVWLSQYDMSRVYCSNGWSQTPVSTYTSKVGTVLQKIKDDGFNTVIVQVRPNADSFYPSEYYPWSAYVVGSYGKTADYDPFLILLEKAHSLGLSIQAWVNPMRAMTTTQIESVSSAYTIKQWYNNTSLRSKYLFTYNNYYFLNPAYPEVRNLIVNGIKEIMSKYNVDGIHMDDYFYPTTSTSIDQAAFSAQSEFTSRSAFRRNNVNLMVKQIYNAVKQANGKALFGISPVGFLDGTIYEELCCDIYTWCQNTGYIDYICPQLYFGMYHQNSPFDDTLDKWIKIVTSSSVKLYVGITLEKAENASQGIQDEYAGTTQGKNEWINSKTVIKTCLQYAKSTGKVTGLAFFSYCRFYDPTTGATNSFTASERNAFMPIMRAW